MAKSKCWVYDLGTWALEDVGAVADTGDELMRALTIEPFTVEIRRIEVRVQSSSSSTGHEIKNHPFYPYSVFLYLEPSPPNNDEGEPVVCESFYMRNTPSLLQFLALLRSGTVPVTPTAAD